jgi:2-polyprenyl-3-methyl-5-hydroxy-6-metoxy-1,4-benzoquinol methylase
VKSPDTNAKTPALKRLAPGRLACAFSRLNFRRMEECATILRWLEPRPGEKVLDIGCGDGAYDRKIARSGAEVTGVDIHEKRLAAARKYYQSAGTRFLFMDASRLDFPDAAFDKALSLCVVEHLGDDEHVMRNLSRVLKPGGLFVFSADSLSHPELTADERNRHQKRYAVNTFYTVDIVRGKLDRAGFDLVDSRYILTTARDLRFIRLSWKLDDLHGTLAPLRTVGYAALGAARKLGSLAPGYVARPSVGGLTLLVRARKRAGARTENRP